MMSNKIEIYTRDFCGFCATAKQLLEQEGLDYQEYNIWRENDKKDEMLSRANGQTTVPQIFIGTQHVGGCDDLYELERQGKLDRLLAA